MKKLLCLVLGHKPVRVAGVDRLRPGERLGGYIEECARCGKQLRIVFAGPTINEELRSRLYKETLR